MSENLFKKVLEKENPPIRWIFFMM